MSKILKLLEQETGGKCYRAYKYNVESESRHPIDYGEDKAMQFQHGHAETKPPERYRDLREQSRHMQQIEGNDETLCYFLDGSRHVYKVDDIAFRVSKGRTAVYPILAGQIGVGCCGRKNRRMYKTILRREWAIALPELADKDGHKDVFFSALGKKMKQNNFFSRFGWEDGRVMSYSVKQEASQGKGRDSFEARGTALIQMRMMEMERESVADLARRKLLDQDHYLVKDGPLDYRLSSSERRNDKSQAAFRRNYNFVIGVSKQFNPHLVKNEKGKESPGFLADLPPFHRTAVARHSYGELEFAVWYVRIRSLRLMATPFDGIVKVEKMLVNEREKAQGIQTEEVDHLSSCLINERRPTCYGSDARWGNHIYPVFLTESYVKSQYVSEESFLQLF